MRKLQVLFLTLPITIFAQVGINTITPSASLDIVSRGNTGTTKAVEVNNSSAVEMLTILNNGNVGINVPNPQKKLHLNAGNDAIRVDALRQITMPNNGVVNVLNYDSGNTRDVTSTAYKSIYSTPVITPNASNTFTDTSGINSGQLVIETGNACGRFMISVFNFTDVSMIHLTSLGRNAIGNATRNDTANSSDWTLNFPDVTGCSDGGNATQFDFRISKTSGNTYVLTNLGNIAKSYKITVTR